MINQVLILQALITQNTLIPVVGLGTKSERGSPLRYELLDQPRISCQGWYKQGSTSFNFTASKSSHRNENSATFYYTAEERASY